MRGDPIFHRYTQYYDADERIIQMDYLATFFTHYGAMRFHKYCVKTGVSSRMTPVPRDLSASCGVCVRFEAAGAPEAVAHEDMEHCYIVASDGVYLLVEG